MKNLFYFLALLFLLGGCTPESDLESFKQKEDTSASSRACGIDIDCSYALQVTEEGCLFDLWAVLEQYKAEHCPNGTMYWKDGTQRWLNLAKGQKFKAKVLVAGCEGFNCESYEMVFTCKETCTTDNCNYNMDIIEGEDACEYAITYECGTELEVDGTPANSIPIGNGVCVSIVYLDLGESSELTFTTEDGEECSEIISCGDPSCDCSELEVQALTGQDDDGCCIISVRTVFPEGFDCTFTEAVHSLTVIDGPPFHAEIIGTGPNWTKFKTCQPISHPTNLTGTVELFLNGVSVCEKNSEPFNLDGCN